MQHVTCVQVGTTDQRNTLNSSKFMVTISVLAVLLEKSGAGVPIWTGVPRPTCIGTLSFCVLCVG